MKTLELQMAEALETVKAKFPGMRVCVNFGMDTDDATPTFYCSIRDHNYATVGSDIGKTVTEACERAMKNASGAKERSVDELHKTAASLGYRIEKI